MRYLLLVGLVLVGCGKVEEKRAAPAKTSYTPSELIALESLPEGVIKVEGKVYEHDRPNNDQRWFISIEDSTIKAIDEDKRIVIMFDSKDKEFSSSLRSWVGALYKEKGVCIKGKAMRIPDDKKKRVYIVEPEVIY